MREEKTRFLKTLGTRPSFEYFKESYSNLQIVAALLIMEQLANLSNLQLPLIYPHSLYFSCLVQLPNLPKLNFLLLSLCIYKKNNSRLQSYILH
jgi:hypothetical protein